MPGPYDISSGSYIGESPYSPRSKAALRRLAPVGDAELYGDDEESAQLAREYLAANPNLTRSTTRTASGTATINGKTYTMGPGGEAREADVWEKSFGPTPYQWQDRPRYDTAKLMQSPAMREWLVQRGEDRRLEREMKREEMRSKNRRGDMEFEAGLRERSPEGKKALAEASLYGAQAKSLEGKVSREVERASVRPGDLEADATLLNSTRASELYRTYAGTMDAPQALAQAKSEARQEAREVESRLASLAQAAQRGDMRAAAQYQALFADAHRKYGSMIMPPSQEVRATVGAAIANDADLQDRLKLLRMQVASSDAANKKVGETWFFDKTERRAAKQAADEAANAISDLATEIAAKYGFDEDQVYKALMSRVTGGQDLFRRVAASRGGF